MKKLIAALMTVLFLGSTTGLALAQGTTSGTTPAAKTTQKAHKKGKKGKKGKKSSTAASTTAPAAK